MGEGEVTVGDDKTGDGLGCNDSYAVIETHSNTLRAVIRNLQLKIADSRRCARRSGWARSTPPRALVSLGSSTGAAAPTAPDQSSDSPLTALPGDGR